MFVDRDILINIPDLYLFHLISYRLSRSIKTNSITLTISLRMMLSHVHKSKYMQLILSPIEIFVFSHACQSATGAHS